MNKTENRQTLIDRNITFPSLEEILGHQENLSRAAPTLFEPPKIKKRGYWLIPIFVGGALGISAIVGTCASVVSSSNSRQIYNSSTTREFSSYTPSTTQTSNLSNSSSRSHSYSNPPSPEIPARALLDDYNYAANIRIPKNNHNLFDTGVYVDEDCYGVNISSKYYIEVVVENRIFKDPIKESKLLGKPKQSDFGNNSSIFMGRGEVRVRLCEGQDIQENEVEVKLERVE